MGRDAIFFFLHLCLSSSMLTLFRGGIVYTPSLIGRADILIGGTKILKISPHIEPCPTLSDIINVIDVSNKYIIPGIVDLHVHATGGGGEMGPASRTPEAQFDQLVEAGTTTVIGVLGTDGISRSLPNLLQKLYGLEEMGLSTFMWTGNYHVPPPSITGSISTDIMYINKIIGSGEIAISDHRSSVPSLNELSRLVADGRVAGMLSAKAGVTYFHVGSGKEKLGPLFDILEKTDIPITQMIPTHVSGRGPALFEDSKRWLKLGGRIDMTADGENETTTADALVQLIQEGYTLENVSVSSDAYGSMPEYDSNGNLIKYDYQKPNVVYNMLKKMVLLYKWKLEDILQVVTKNPAKFLGLEKGELKVNRDADLVVLDSTTFIIEYVYSKGEVLKTPTWTKPSMFVCV